jgi:hypothetical protein
LAALRAQFDDQVQDFVQDQKIDALVDEVEDLRDAAGMGQPDPEFESRRDALRESLTNWQAPEGTSPEDAAELKAQLQSLVDSYQPQPGQSADQALAALRAQFDDQVQDFVQDQKIDALVDEQMRDNAAATDSATDAATDSPTTDTTTTDPTAGTGMPGTDADTGADTASGDTGMTTGDMDSGDMDTGDNGMTTGDMTTGDMTTGDVTTGDMDSGDMDSGDMGGMDPDPRVTMPRDVLTDDFDDMVGDGPSSAPEDLPTFAMGEPTPGQPIEDLDIDFDLGVATGTDGPSIFDPDNPDSPFHDPAEDMFSVAEDAAAPVSSALDDDDIFSVGDLGAASADSDDDLGSMFQNTGIVPPHITDAPDFGADDLDLPDLPDLDLPDLDGPDTSLPSMPDLDDASAMDDLPSPGHDLDDDLDGDLGPGGMDADDMNDPLSGI